MRDRPVKTAANNKHSEKTPLWSGGNPGIGQPGNVGDEPQVNFRGNSDEKIIQMNPDSRAKQENADEIEEGRYDTEFRENLAVAELRVNEGGEKPMGFQQRLALRELVKLLNMAIKGDQKAKKLLPDQVEVFQEMMPLHDEINSSFLAIYQNKQLRYNQVFDIQLMHDIIFRLRILGLNESAKNLDRFTKWKGSTNEMQLAIIGFAEELEQNQSKLSANDSFDQLIESAKISYSIIHDLKSYYKINNLGKIQLNSQMLQSTYGAINGHLQLRFDELFSYLKVNYSNKIVIIDLFDEISQKLISLDVIAKLESDTLSNEEFKEFIYNYHVIVRITKSEFDSRKKKHIDYHNNPDDKSSPKVVVKSFNRDQVPDQSMEKVSSFSYIIKYRLDQLTFLQNFMNVRVQDPDQIEEAAYNAAVLEEHFQPGFDFTSLDDWREFLLMKYENLINRGKSKAEAFILVANLLMKYFKSFAISSFFDIDDLTRNYLTNDFPRAMTGQLIHDCGVYALRSVYMLSLLKNKLGLKMRYIVLPNHIGLLVTGDQLPVLIIHNNSFSVHILDQQQKSEINPKTLESLQLQETLDAKRSRWDAQVKKQGASFNTDEDNQFIGELASVSYMQDISLPFRLEDIDDHLFNSKKPKKALWKNYKKVAKTDAFNDNVRDDKNDYYQVNLSYLTFSYRYIIIYNSQLVKFWNQQAPKVWNEYNFAFRYDNPEFGAALNEYYNSLEYDYGGFSSQFGDLMKEKRQFSVALADKKDELFSKGTEIADLDRLQSLERMSAIEQMEEYFRRLEFFISEFENGKQPEIEDLHPPFMDYKLNIIIN